MDKWPTGWKKYQTMTTASLTMGSCTFDTKI
jgi:hypothetical protein